MNELTVWKDQTDDLEFSCEILIPDKDLLPSEIDVAGSTALALASAHKLHHEDVVDIKFDSSITDADKWDYIIAAASGVLTAALDVLWRTNLSLTEAQSWGKKETDAFVLKVAKAVGYKGNDLAGAIRTLEELFPIAADKLTPEFGGGLQHHLRDFSHHPTLAGLVFSILTQFTGMGYGTDTDGIFQCYKVPDTDLIGANFEEKIFRGIVMWALHLISDMAGSSSNPGKGTGIPGMLLSLMKELSVLPFFKNISVECKGDEISFSKLVSKMFNGTYFVDKDSGEKVRFDLRAEIGLVQQLTKQTIPVIINECIVRGFYMIRRLCLEISAKDIQHFRDWERIDFQNIAPWNNRTITRMLTISSGTFMAIVTGSAAVRAAVKNKGFQNNFALDFLLSINYVGVGRFVFACAADAKYVAEDFKKAYKEFKYSRDYTRPRSVPGLAYLSLSENQTRILYSLKRAKTQYDIESAKVESVATQKRKWLSEWSRAVLEGLGIEKETLFFVAESTLCEMIDVEIGKTDNLSWLYLIAMDLYLFTPYYALDSEEDKEYKKLKYKCNYEKDRFCEIQKTLDYDSLEALMKLYHKNLGVLDNKTQKTITGAAVAAVATIATGGIAWAFAPQIAVALAGSSFIGLHGAALTSASLAAIGGGSLAAGGLGMAGGTAIIAGGGALLGVAGSGAASLSSLMLMASKDYAQNECAKLMTFCEQVLLPTCGKEPIVAIQHNIEKGMYKLEKDIDQLIANPDTDDKTQQRLLKESKVSLKYITRCYEYLLKLIQ